MTHFFHVERSKKSSADLYLIYGKNERPIFCKAIFCFRYFLGSVNKYSKSDKYQ